MSSSEERLKKVDEFFKDLSIEEFEEILIKAGIDEIKPSKDFGYEMGEVINN